MSADQNSAAVVDSANGASAQAWFDINWQDPVYDWKADAREIKAIVAKWGKGVNIFAVTAVLNKMMGCSQDRSAGVAMLKKDQNRLSDMWSKVYQDMMAAHTTDKTVTIDGKTYYTGPIGSQGGTPDQYLTDKFLLDAQMFTAAVAHDGYYSTGDPKSQGQSLIDLVNKFPSDLAGPNKDIKSLQDLWKRFDPKGMGGSGTPDPNCKQWFDEGSATVNKQLQNGDASINSTLQTQTKETSSLSDTLTGVLKSLQKLIALLVNNAGR